MNSLIKAVAIAVALSAPVVSFAQSNQPLTRAEVRAQLVQLEKAGYRPGGDQATYPVQIEAAEARVAAENGSTSGVGGVVSGSSESGAPAAAVSSYPGERSLYVGH
ncbi:MULTISPECIES: DUF4148 domain-containing protein [Paraburkholderia]|jgi:hypothetical protein|uniref:DUF4148 domain-containing protein n=1 Tax=Paraburkholderia phenazinium TaxID=60549 RepID=A0A1N6KXS5_9BURK|nr:DUF4148 domain-containing protein [Paraburkholderia phenazinium]SIO61348.1 protein of unknown function [Paraburkholderia phenazinium]